MRRTYHRYLALALLCGVLFGCFSFQSFAAETNGWEGMTSELLSDVLEAEDIWENIMRGTYLQRGNSKISNQGNRVVKISGGTDAYQTCDVVMATIYLDRYENGTWVEVTSAPFTSYNAKTTNGSKSVSVAGGDYYRARGYHTIYKGSTVESEYTLTDGIWIP